MLRYVCAVKDRASGVFGTPFFVVAVGAATRSFRDEVNRSAADNQMYQHPEDFSLWQIGSFDDESGSVSSELRFLLEAGDCLDFSNKE